MNLSVIQEIASIFSKIGVFPGSEIKLLSIVNKTREEDYNEVEVPVKGEDKKFFILRNGCTIELIKGYETFWFGLQEQYINIYGKPHRKYGPAILTHSITSTIENPYVVMEEWRFEGKLHRIEGPAVILYYMNQFNLRIIQRETWFFKGKRYRIGGPGSTYYFLKENSDKFEKVHKIWYEEGDISRLEIYYIKEDNTQVLEGKKYYSKGKFQKEEIYYSNIDGDLKIFKKEWITALNSLLNVIRIE